MANKFIDWVVTFLLWTAIGLLIGGVLYLFIQPIVEWTDQSEFRLYCRLALLLLSIIAFGVLRLYNSIVQNTRFLLKIREVAGKLLAELPNLQRSLNMLGSKTDSLRGTVANNTKVLGTLSDEARDLLTSLKQNGNLKKPN